MLSALLVQEICSAFQALLLLTSVQPKHVVEHGVLEEFAGEIDGARGLVRVDRDGLAVGRDLGAAIGPQQRVEPAVVVAKAMAELEAERMILGLQLLADFVAALPRYPEIC